MKRQGMMKVDITEAKAALLDGFCNALNGAEDVKEGVEEMITARDTIDFIVKAAAKEDRADQELNSDLVTIDMNVLKAWLFDKHCEAFSNLNNSRDLELAAAGLLSDGDTIVFLERMAAGQNRPAAERTQRERAARFERRKSLRESRQNGR